jgi:alkanesulfonate monooxygenase SsuD/methylene tetrahydromethanopterin reductase-like flavin-dependent oxidoreductase (luciferase family)
MLATITLAVSMIEFGCCLPQNVREYGIARRIAQESEKLGFQSVWLYDHLYPYNAPLESPCYEIWTTLSALTEATSRIRLGTMVLCNSFRYPSIVAKMTSTLDNISQGRIEVGIGAGWYKKEFDAYGIPFSTSESRTESLRDGIQIIKKMWTEESVTYKGTYHSVESVYNSPKPLQKPHPPLWVGGTYPPVMRIAAELADGWNIGFYPSNTPAGFGRRVATLDSYCREIGRNPSTLRKSWLGEIVMAQTQAEVQRKVARLKPTDMSMHEYKVARIIGIPDECLKQIQDYVEKGCSYFMLSFAEVEELEPLHLFAEAILSHFR